jgi:excisionase family DNA binding protein
MTEYNVTVETDAPADRAEELADVLLSAKRLSAYSPAVHAAPNGCVAVTLTLPGVDEEPPLAAATGGWDTVLPYLPDGVRIVGLAVLPTEEFDRRAGADDAPMLSVPEAAAALGVSQQRVRQLLDGGKLSGMKVGRDWLVSRVSVQQRLDSR